MTNFVPPITFSTAAPSVFISSTVRDFADLRAGIKYVLTQRGVNVMMSEASDFPVYGDRSAVDECLENIRNSDLYVLVVDKRQGSIYTPGVSVTRTELRAARESFARRGKPHQLLFVRSGVLPLVNRRNAALLAAGVDDPKHLRSFIKEITNPNDPLVHNFLKEFDSFEEIMDSITARLNLGKNIAESLARRTVYKELTRNLAKMVSRAGSAALEKHAALLSLRKEFDRSSFISLATIGINDSQRTRLIMGVLGRSKASSFETDAIRNALAGGVFLQYDPASGMITESRIHEALSQILEDIASMSSYDDVAWDGQLFETLQRPGVYQVDVADLTMALAFGADAENLFNQMRAVCWMMTDSNNADVQIVRLPTTPLGLEEALRIRKERVESWEVDQLFSEDIFPFGSRIPSELGDRVKEDMIQSIIHQFHDLEATQTTQNLTSADLHSIASKIVNERIADPNEGLEEISGLQDETIITDRNRE